MGLFETEKQTEDLDNLSLEDLLEAETKKETKAERKEKAKEVFDKSLDISKKVASTIKEKSNDMYEQHKEKREYNKENNIDNADDVLKKFLQKYGISATFAKAEANREFKKHKKTQDAEGILMVKNVIRETLNERFGIYGLMAYYGSFLFMFLMCIQLFRTSILTLPFFFLIYRYVAVNVKYSKNSTFFDFKWYLQLVEQDVNYRSESARATYCLIPKALFEKDENIEDYLEKRGRKFMAEGATKASIRNSKIKYDEHYGWIRVLEINNTYFMREVRSLADVELNAYYFIPQKVNDSDYTSEVFYQSFSYIHQDITPLIASLFSDNNADNVALNAKNYHVDLITSDSRINYAYTEIAERLEAQAEAEAEKQREDMERMELIVLKQQIREKGLSSEVANIIKKIRDNKDNWNFNVWNGNDNMAGNKSYFKVRCVLRNKRSVTDVERLKNAIEAELRKKIMIKARQDRGAFDLVVLLNENLDMYAVTMKELDKYNARGEMFIGKSLTGELSSKWNYQANHFMVGGYTGSGKSVEILNILAQLVNISKFSDEFDYTTMFLTSSSKIADFIDFDKAGALVVSGIDKQIAVFRYVLKELERREALFYKEEVQNIKDYNKKFPNHKMKQLVLLADEYENTRQDLDKKKAQEAEGLIAQILNIARSSGGVVITGSQSVLKGAVGVIRDKMTVKISGFNEKNVLNQLDTEIANYYQTLQREPQGVFFYNALNLKPLQDSLNFGETSFTLIQTPYIKDISARTLGELHGAEFESEIFEDLEPKITEINEVREEEILDLFK